MTKLIILMAVCFVGRMAMTTKPVLGKPYYDLENAEDLFRDFVKEYEKSYSRKEYSERLENFKESLKEINRLNAENPGTVFDVNHFADLKPEELQQFNGLMPPKGKGVEVTIDSSVVAPDSFDWRDQHVVSHVKNQMGCGSCYIFSAIGNIEGQYAIKHKECLVLSEQQVLDCLDCGSCSGGFMEDVMQEFANRSTQAMLEKDYPYKSVEDECHEDAKKAVVHVTSGQKLDIQDEEMLKQKLVELGPLAVGLAATFHLSRYRGGVYKLTEECKNMGINHGVLLVGYGEENDGTKYWIIKNSWGEKWGEKGYLRLLRGVNACQMGTGYTASATVA